MMQIEHYTVYISVGTSLVQCRDNIESSVAGELLCERRDKRVFVLSVVMSRC